MDQVERIAKMQQTLDESVKAVSQMKTVLEQFQKAQEMLQKIESYYGSSQWYDDVHADQKGLFPDALKRSILCEEDVYELLMENRDLAITMLEVGTDIVKH